MTKQEFDGLTRGSVGELTVNGETLQGKIINRNTNEFTYEDKSTCDGYVTVEVVIRNKKVVSLSGYDRVTLIKDS